MGQQVGNWSICHALLAKRKPIVHPTSKSHLFHSKSIDLPIPKIWLLKIWPWKSKVKVKDEVTTWVQHPMDSHPFMSIQPLIPMIELFKYLTFKIQGQSHSSRSHNRYNILSTHIPFIPCWSALPFLRCSCLKNWPWKFKVKVMGEVKVQSHNMGLTSYRLTSLSFHVNRPSHSWDTAFSKFDLENQGSGSNDPDVAQPVASFTKEVNLRLAKRPLKTNGRLANHGLTSLVKEATEV